MQHRQTEHLLHTAILQNVSAYLDHLSLLALTVDNKSAVPPVPAKTPPRQRVGEKAKGPLADGSLAGAAVTARAGTHISTFCRGFVVLLGATNQGHAQAAGIETSQ